MSCPCEVYDCIWKGDQDDLFDHCDRMHSSSICELDENNTFVMSLETFLQVGVRLFCCDAGLYWFNIASCESADRKKTIACGLMPVANTKPTEFFIRFGSFFGEGPITGPFNSIATDAEPYPVALIVQSLMDSQRLFHIKTVAIIVGEQAASLVKNTNERILPHGPEQILWNQDSRRINAKLLQLYTCPICFEFMQSEIRHCENNHLICGKCFQKCEQTQGKRIRCAVCRGFYNFDNRDERFEKLASLLDYSE